jgi:hypothetical protein
MMVQLNKPRRIAISRDTAKPGEHVRLWIAGVVERVDDGKVVLEVLDSAEDAGAGLCPSCVSVI